MAISKAALHSIGLANGKEDNSGVAEWETERVDNDLLEARYRRLAETARDDELVEVPGVHSGTFPCPLPQ